MPRRLTILLPILSGILTALCLPRLGLCFLGWISLIPLIKACRNSTPSKSFVWGSLAGFAFHGVALYWIYSTCRFAQINIGVACLAWAALSLALGVNWGLISASASWVSAALKKGFRPWIWAIFWAAWEVLWLKTPRICIDIPAYTQYRYLSLIQINSIIGPQGLGFLVVLFNASLAEFKSPLTFKENYGAIKNILLSGVLVLGVWAYGHYSLSKIPKASGSLAVEILQPNIDQYQKWDAASAAGIVANFENLLATPRLKSPQLIIWPEAALPRTLTGDASIPEASPWSVKFGAYQIVGAVIENLGRLYNGAYFIGKNGIIKGSYCKRELVPFGEYVPWDFLRNFIGYLDQLGNLTPGLPIQTPFKTSFGKIACTICYEAVFPELARSEAVQDARFLVNITNDGWYKETWGPYQHFYVNIFRAVENRVYVLRAANTGISAVIDPWGRVLKSLPLNTRGRLDVDIPLGDPFPLRSFYARHGDWFGFLCLALALGVAFFRLLFFRKIQPN